MKIEQPKLVRDRIPEIIGRSGVKYEIEILSEGEYRTALGAKLLEESREVIDALEENPETLSEELADLREVIDAIARLMGIESGEIARVQERKRLDRGGFEGRIRLIRVDSTR